MKTRTLLIAAVMFLGLTAASFAQATFSVGSIPVTAVVNTGQVELTGAVTFTQTSGVTNNGTITISYGVPITSAFSSVTVTALAGSQFATANCGASFGLPTNVCVSSVTVNTTASSNANGLLVLNVPAGVGISTAGEFGSFTVSGARVAIAGTGLTTLTASLSTTNNAITAGQTSVVVISSIQPGIASVGVKSGGISPVVGSINAVSGGVTATAVVVIKEGFLNAWGDPTNLTAAGLRITLSAAPPAGVTITFPALVTTDGATPVANPTFVTINSDGSGDGSGNTTGIGAVSFTSTSTNLSVFYKATTTTDPTKQETLAFNVTFSVSSSATLPLPSTSITYVVSMAPIGTAFKSNGDVITDTNLIPRYAALDVGPAGLLTITGLSTTMLVPFAQTVTALGFNTGLAISNTTEDPGKTAMGFGTATPQTGKITFYFFPALPSASATNPTNFNFTPTGTFGHGLDANGNLISGGTFVALVSEILAAASQPADFSGYIFIVTNFTNAHGFWTISDFKSFSQGGAMLVLPGTDRTSVPETLNN